MGRVEEQQVLGAAIQGLAEGEPCAVFVHGEAGVGKTRLVRAVCEDAASNGAAVLWGRCVRFGSVDTPYVALVGALEGWLESAEASERSAVLAAVPAAAELLPSLGGQPARSMVRLLPVLDGLVRALVSLRPAVLVVDDVQWADLASRDAITYLVAGFRSQRLAVLATCRDEELAVGHPMHVWLADLMRLPAVSSLRLDRLSRDETEEQLSLLLGGRPDPRLLAEVVQRSDGNPYFSELLVQGLTAADGDLPADLPAELTAALLAAWHRLSAPSREVMRVLAVGGRPASVDDLTEVVAARAIGAEAVTVALVEATSNGICVTQAAELCWFRHPLFAEVLNATFVPGEAAPIHVAWAKALESRSAGGIDELRRVGDLAQHYDGAHDPQACLAASLRAADLARDLKALPEEAVHLGRALRLLPTVPDRDTRPDRELDLLERLVYVSDLVGGGEAAFSASSRALELVDEREDPLRASRILRKHGWVALTAGQRTGAPFAECERAVQLCEPFPDSAEYAMALADLSSCHSWTDEVETAQRYAEEAVRAARRSGSHEALTHAYSARADAYRRDQRADRDTLESVRHARQQNDPDRLIFARVGRRDYLWTMGRRAEATELEADILREAVDSGALRVAAYHAGAHARSLLMFGRFLEADRATREGLALARTPHASVQVRLAAALLSVRRGDIDRARLHLQRANELMPGLEHDPALYAPPVLAEYLVATGRPDRALGMLTRTLVEQFVDLQIADEMLLWAARAAADMAEHARDRRDGDGVTHARGLLDDIVELRQDLRPNPFERITTEDLFMPALEALYTAETARCLAQSPTSAVWEVAVHLCADCGLRWEEAIASRRLAQALLTEGASRAAVAVPLRSAHHIAVELGAMPLQQQVETIGTLGKIPLVEPVAPSSGDLPEVLRSLTQREREVLAHLVAGRTYAEIAAALFISEKTVSVHVSNLLRKTDTSSGREVAALATRLGYS